MCTRLAYSPIMNLTSPAALQQVLLWFYYDIFMYVNSADLLYSAWRWFFFIEMFTALNMLLQILKSTPTYF